MALLKISMMSVMALVLVGAVSGAQVCHFDSPGEIGSFLKRKNPEAFFESGTKAAGAGALKASGFSRTFRPEEKISKVTFYIYDDTFSARKT